MTLLYEWDLNARPVPYSNGFSVGKYSIFEWSKQSPVFKQYLDNRTTVNYNFFSKSGSHVTIQKSKALGLHLVYGMRYSDVCFTSVSNKA